MVLTSKNRVMENLITVVNQPLYSNFDIELSGRIMCAGQAGGYFEGSITIDGNTTTGEFGLYEFEESHGFIIGCIEKNNPTAF